MDTGGYWTNSIVLWTRALETDPNNAIAHLNVGNAYNDNGLQDVAMEHFLKARDLAPILFQPWNNLGIMYHRAGRYQEAVRHLQVALTKMPRSASVYTNLGVSLASMGQTAFASNAFNAAVRIDPVYFQAQRNMAVLLDGEKQPERAIIYYYAALKIKPNDNDTRTRYASALIRVGRDSEGREMLANVLKSDPDFTAAKELDTRLRQGLRPESPLNMKDIEAKKLGTQPASQPSPTSHPIEFEGDSPSSQPTP